MSCNYYRVTHQPDKVEGYGFKKVTEAELNDIVSRLTKHTYNSRVQEDEYHRVHNYSLINAMPPPRTPTYCARRFSTGSQSGKISKDRKLTERELERLIRRVRRPTRAHEVSRRDYEGKEQWSTPPGSRSSSESRPMTASERKKAFHQLSRPTTASKGKHAVECHLCTDEERELNQTLTPFEYPYADDRSVTRDEVECIVSRVRSPTRASQKGKFVCARATPDYQRVRIQSEQLPLVSGLERSKSVTQIVNRLYYGSSCRRVRRGHMTPQATPITDFYAKS